MSRYYRYRIPLWARKCIFVVETCITPILVFQIIRTLLIPTAFDILILAVLIGLALSFYMQWI
ncbi:hypothetical protein [Oceanobacillus neutriphilus]|uniref:Uncharacterized protein n=1 Tax=Oceanobacillus neutriphilus TaxID=531815 RepID=A0ABQ2NYC4_9BACI|nr:hypothetical protein [Oceanobacillus neutriphilus]GGP13629.1 hypothetical protein GCM10011346_34380 [Oceanobacillus neutriphilus]